MRLFRTLLVFGFLLTTATLHFSFAQDGGVSAPAASVFEFPRDHLLHHNDPLMNENYIEWHYFTGIVRDDEGREWGYQVTLFTQILLGQQVFLYDIALSDLLNSQFLHHRGTTTGDMSAADTLIYTDATFHLELTDNAWLIRFAGDAIDMSLGDSVPLNFDLVLEPLAYDYILHGPDGAAEMGDCNGNLATFDGYTYYYSHPALSTAGTISVADTDYVISGDTWFDHQWGNFTQCTLAWNWFSLRLDDGRFMMLFQFLDEEGNPLPNLLGASYLDTDGTINFWVGEDAVILNPTRFWTHPDQRVDFALEWIIETPVGTFAIEPYFDNQTPSYLAGIPYYWEGVIHIRDGSHHGEQIGMGYLEVVPRLE